MHKGQFIISLDFELYWGVRDKRSIEEYGENILGVQQVIPALLAAFEQYDVNATFATVGFLFARDKKEILRYKPPVVPVYSKSEYSPYDNYYLESTGNSEADDRYHYGYSLLTLIHRHPEQEIASHTFSHYYCLENASIQSFKEDMQAAKNIALKENMDVTTIIFPRNQYSTQHLEVCKNLGFTCYRGNENSFIYMPRKNDKQNLFIRVVRLLDSYINLTGHHCSPFPQKSTTLVNLPASRFLRPYHPKLRYFERMKINRIKKSMTHAAKNNLVFHLWWHPHNFGKNLEENMTNLREILKHYKTLHQQFGFQSITMNSLAKIAVENE